ncbi:MAG TPA: hypothetical protein VFA86_06045 [Gammaproteobacteria bacterium]|nr:hypothetical protein [Gammaproteobacteria bacterium]
MDGFARAVIGITERGLVPEALVRAGIRQLLAQRLRTLPASDGPHAEAHLRAFSVSMAYRLRTAQARHRSVVRSPRPLAGPALEGAGRTHARVRAGGGG